MAVLLQLYGKYSVWSVARNIRDNEALANLAKIALQNKPRPNRQFVISCN